MKRRTVFKRIIAGIATAIIAPHVVGRAVSSGMGPTFYEFMKEENMIPFLPPPPYLIREAIDDPRYGRITMVHLPVLDGPIDGYIKSPHFIVTDRKGNEIKTICKQN